MNIGAILSRAIKQGSWVYISYKNALDEITYFWISIIDVDSKEKSFKIYGFNDQLSTESKIFEKIYFNRILTAQIIDGTFYSEHEEVIKKVDSDYLSYEWLAYYDISDKVLSYYEQCYNEDVDVEEDNFNLLPGFDEYQIDENLSFRLTDTQRKILLKLFKNKIKDEKSLASPSYEKLAYSLVSIKTKTNKLIPLFYYDVKFDITNNKLVLNKKVKFNSKFKTQEYTYNLRRLIEADIEILANELLTKKDEVIKTIEQSLSRKELIDTRPYLIRITKQIQVPIGGDLTTIKQQYFASELSRPLNAFFGRFANVNARRKRISNLMLLDEKVNIEQLRAMYHALNQDITYVQGPPGTGKTTLIKNVILSSLLNNRSVLVTSNNNEAINNIIRGYESKVDQLIAFPYLRLGNLEYMDQALNTIRSIFERIETIAFDQEVFDNVVQKSNISIEDLNQVIEKYEDKLELETQREVLTQVIEKNIGNLKFIKFQEDLKELDNQLEKFEGIDDVRILRSVLGSQDGDLAKDFLTQETNRRLIKLKFPRYEWLKKLVYSDDKKKVYHFAESLSDNDQLDLLIDVFPIIFSTNLGSRRLGNATPHFDLLIMDEAGQSAVSTSLLPMARCERLLLVGDTNQLQPITQIDPHTNEELIKAFGIPKTYDYANNSILKLMQTVDTNSPSIMLKEHYRSDKKIIGFSNKKYYDNQLIVKKPDQPAALRFVQVKSNIAYEKNTAYEEAMTIAREIKRQPNADIGVITPFKNQADLINKSLAELNVHNVKVGTIHTFQGNENSTIYLSLGLTNQTSQFAYDWIKDNQELMNVATTRAKDKLIVVGNEDIIHQYSGQNNSDIKDLVNYTKKFGLFDVKESALSDKQRLFGLKALNSKFESDFLDTLNHFLDIYGALKVKEKIKITDLFSISSQYPYFNYANTAHIDFVVFDLKHTPLLAIELNGNEHYNNQEVTARDQKKKTILDQYGLKLISIPNHYARRYDLIRNTVVKLMGE